ncbi:MAG: hypothetical protein KGI71_04935 [Patescibacteria group bacterium]|nr:hypothetical protein [Patescibacteria group bacterium]
MTPTLLLAAILLCRPAMPPAEARAYAEILAPHDDALTIVALIDRETGWHANAVSSDGRYLGLGQIAWRYRCARGVATVHRARCATERRRLLDGRYNLRAVLHIIDQWRTTCRTTVGWISAYEGARRPTGQRCGQPQEAQDPPRVTLAILARAEELRRQLR